QTFTFDDTYRQGAEKIFAALSREMRGGSAVKLLTALDYYLDRSQEILIVPGEGIEPRALLTPLHNSFHPNHILAVAESEAAVGELTKLIPLFENKMAIRGQTTAYVCEKGHCELPTSDPEVFARQIGKPSPLSERPIAALVIPDPVEEPKAWEYDQANNRHWHPGHRHWHPGVPPQGN
ncbi:MAG: hypothetical protein ACNA8W_22515, partial [Bradymonadaceae bacterium]